MSLHSSPHSSRAGGSLFICGGRIIDPASGRDEIGDLLVTDGVIAESTAEPRDGSATVIDAAGLIVAPGLIDMHVHLREPGGTQKETIASGSRAAAAGGFTSILAMPNTTPPADGPNTIALMRQRAAETACVNVFVSGCITVGMKGEQLAPIGSLFKAGVVAITDDGHCVQNNEVMRRALDYARMFDLLTLDHCQDYNLSAGGVMHEGYWSTVLGLPGWPRIAEDMIVARNILLSELTGARVHVQHLSSAESVRLVREAKKRNVKISAEAMPHHIALTDASIEGYNTNFKMNPPLREKSDQDALLAGLADDTIEILASDHAPHAGYEKEVEFADAPFGIVGAGDGAGDFREGADRGPRARLAADAGETDDQSRAAADAGSRDTGGGRTGGHHADRSAAGVESGPGEILFAEPQHAVQRVGTARARDAYDCGWARGLEFEDGIQ